MPPAEHHGNSAFGYHGADAIRSKFQVKAPRDDLRRAIVEYVCAAGPRATLVWLDKLR